MVDDAPIPTEFDGFGRRNIGKDSETGEDVELLDLAAPLVEHSGFVTTLAERVARLASVRHASYVHLRRVDRPDTDRLQLVSDLTQGWRLSELLEESNKQNIAIDISIAISFLRQLLPAVALFGRHNRDAAIGTLSVERLIVTPQARLVIAEHAFGPAIEKLNMGREKLWRDLRVAMPPSAGLPRSTPRSDAYGIGLIALSMLLGRPLTVDEFPAQLESLLKGAVEYRDGKESPLSTSFSNWLQRALQFDAKTAFQTPSEAQLAFESVLASDRSYVTSTKSVDQWVQHLGGTLGVRGVPKADPEVARQQEAEREQEAQREREREAELERLREAERARAAEVERLREQEKLRAQEVEKLREQEKAREQEREREREADRQREQQRQQELEKQLEKEREKAREEEKKREQQREKEREQERQREQQRLQQELEREREKARAEEQKREQQREKEREQERQREQQRQKELEKERERARAAEQEAEARRRDQEDANRRAAAPAAAEEDPIAAQIASYKPKFEEPAPPPPAQMYEEPAAPEPVQAYEEPAPPQTYEAPAEYVPEQAAPAEPPAPAASYAREESRVDDEPAKSKMPMMAMAAVIVLLLGAVGWFATRGGGEGGGLREGEGELAVQSRPPGARVIVDGKEVGVTPATVRLPAGPHVLEVQVGKLEPRVIPLTISAGVQTSQYIELEDAKLTGSLSIRSEPSGARISVDGQPRGTTPATIPNLSAGEHTVVLELGGRKATQTVKIDPGSTAQLVVPMPRR